MRYKGILNGTHSDTPPSPPPPARSHQSPPYSTGPTLTPPPLAPRSLPAHTCSSPPTCALKSPSQRSSDSGTTWGAGWKCEQNEEASQTPVEAVADGIQNRIRVAEGDEDDGIPIQIR